MFRTQPTLQSHCSIIPSVYHAKSHLPALLLVRISNEVHMNRPQKMFLNGVNNMEETPIELNIELALNSQKWIAMRCVIRKARVVLSPPD